LKMSNTLLDNFYEIKYRMFNLFNNLEIGEK
jgi:hypothetical protein